MLIWRKIICGPSADGRTSESEAEILYAPKVGSPEKAPSSAENHEETESTLPDSFTHTVDYSVSFLVESKEEAIDSSVYSMEQNYYFE